MKSTPTNSTGRLSRICLITFAVIGMTTQVSCGKRDSWLPFGDQKSACEKAYDSLESQFQDLKASVTGGTTSADRAAFWQATAALFIVLSGFALVGGAALGSRARRERERFQDQQASSTTGITEADRQPPVSPGEVTA